MLLLIVIHLFWGISGQLHELMGVLFHRHASLLQSAELICLALHGGRGDVISVAEPLELSRLKCAGHHHKGNTSSNALQTEQFLVCRVTSRYNNRFSDRTSIPRTKASPEI